MLRAKNNKMAKSVTCALLGHSWTNDAVQGIDPAPQLLAAGAHGYIIYARQYCSRCGKHRGNES